MQKQEELGHRDERSWGGGTRGAGVQGQEELGYLDTNDG